MKAMLVIASIGALVVLGLINASPSEEVNHHKIAAEIDTGQVIHEFAAIVTLEPAEVFYDTGQKLASINSLDTSPSAKKASYANLIEPKKMTTKVTGADNYGSYVFIESFYLKQNFPCHTHRLMHIKQSQDCWCNIFQ
jgi:hypothetical protein